MGLLGVVVDALAHSVVHKGPVVLVTRRPDLETIRARIFFSALPDPETVADPDQLTSRVTLHRDVCDLAVACAALPTAFSCNNKFGQTSIEHGGMLQTANNNDSGAITKRATRILPRKERTSTNSQAQPQKSEYYKDAL